MVVETQSPKSHQFQVPKQPENWPLYRLVLIKSIFLFLWQKRSRISKTCSRDASRLLISTVSRQEFNSRSALRPNFVSSTTFFYFATIFQTWAPPSCLETALWASRGLKFWQGSIVANNFKFPSCWSFLNVLIYAFRIFIFHSDCGRLSSKARSFHRAKYLQFSTEKAFLLCKSCTRKT